jgi:hypothetical protein
VLIDWSPFSAIFENFQQQHKLAFCTNQCYDPALARASSVLGQENDNFFVEKYFCF